MEPTTRFLAVGHHGLRLFSADGTSWQDAQTGKEGEVYRAAAFGNGHAVAVGTYGGVNILAASRDGKKWELTTKDGKYALFVRGLGFGKDQFLAIGGDPGAVGVSRPFETHSTDGVSWSDLREIGGKNILRRLAYGNDRFVGVGDRGRRAVSPDGKEWKDAPDVKAIDTLVDVAFGNGVFVGVGLHSLRMTSADGLTWTDRQVGEEGEHLNSVVWAKDRFVAVGQGATYISADGKMWQRTPNKDAPLTVAFGAGVFIGANWKGRLLRSDDAVTWREVHKCEHHIEAVAFGALG
jgi:hypothetical protein